LADGPTFHLSVPSGILARFAKALIEKRYDICLDPEAAIASLDAPNDNDRVAAG
jgi:hypothetical protein